jgi:hypothetical protein
MAALNTDKLKKLSRRWVGQIGSGGVSDATVTTIPLASTTNLPTDTAVVATIDRVDANGTATPSLEETIIGVVSGSNLSTSTRGVEGTAQAHSAGAVVEILVTAKGWNDIVDHLLVEHNQDGTHKSALVTTLKATGAEVTTGTSDVKIVTPKALADAGFVLDTDGTLAANSDTRVPSEKAVKTYVDTNAAIITTAKFAPQGFLINGKISITVASNNITVAIKGMDGNDPSSTNKVYCRIGDTVRTITAALSVTKNAGTNWFNSGGSELATNEIDYFVYLGYNATDGVVIGFARIPNATKYGDFSATTTNERYAAISTITTAASTDYYENIGRFAATLSATASFNWSVPAFTALNLIQRPIIETRLLTWTLVYTGFSSAPTTTSAQYQVKGSQCYLYFVVGSGGTSNATGFTFTAPFKNNGPSTILLGGQSFDNGAAITTAPLLNFTTGGNSVNVYKDYSGPNWTGSGTKYLDRFQGQFQI